MKLHLSYLFLFVQIDTSNSFLSFVQRKPSCTKGCNSQTITTTSATSIKGKQEYVPVPVSMSSSSSSSSSVLLNSSSSSNDEKVQTPNFHHKASLPESFYTQILSTNSISSVATKLRLSYDNHFQDPRQPNSKRFVWDPWFVQVGDGVNANANNSNGGNDNLEEEEEDTITIDGEVEAANKQIQYSLKRIQSNAFFTDDEFGDLVDQLTELGRSIGLTAITPPWMSLYTNDDRQNLHTDAPQGQMAFVLSLCKEGDFDGGETIMLRSEILDYWKGFDGSRGLESGGISRFIPPTPLGRCIVFDPRVPHGVNVVDGTQDPRKGRVVIHGWFNEPEVCWFGPWGGKSTEESVVDHGQQYDDSSSNPAIEEANQILEVSFEPLLQTLGSGEIGRVMGYLAIQLEIDEYGEVEDVFAVCDTLKADWDDYRGIIGYDEAERPVMEDAVSDVKLTIYETLKNLNFGDGEIGRSVVVPFAFE